MVIRNIATCAVLLFICIGYPARSWADDQQPPTPRSIGNEADWVSPDDYPNEALREERQGVTTTLLVINKSGRVAECRIAESSGHADLDAAACAALTDRARFEPARNARGTPVVGYYPKRVRWQLPATGTLPAVDSSYQSALGLIVRMHILPSGEVGECRVLSAAGEVLIDARPYFCPAAYASVAEMLPSEIGPDGLWLDVRTLQFFYDRPPGWAGGAENWTPPADVPPPPPPNRS